MSVPPSSSGSENSRRLEGLSLPSGLSAESSSVTPSAAQDNQDRLNSLHVGAVVNPGLSPGGPVAPAARGATGAHQRPSPWLWIALVAVVLAIGGVTLGLVRSGDSAESTSDASGIGASSPSEPRPVGQSPKPGADGSPFSEPSDMRALINSVTATTVFLECDQGFGTGFAFDAAALTGGPRDVLVVTNEHVLAGCADVSTMVGYANNGESRVEVIGTDKALDLALLHLPAVTIATVALGDEPEAGQWVMAVGHPEGVTDSVSFGYVTAYKPDEDLITHDAVLGPGNSGGPLVDNQGRVMGVNSAVWQEATGISVAIPIRELCTRLLNCQG